MASIALTTSLTGRFSLTVVRFPALSASSARYAALNYLSYSPIRGLKYRKASLLRRGKHARCAYNPKDDSGAKSEVKEGGQEWAILKRWDVPWEWHTISLTSLACGLSFVVTGLVEQAALPYLGINITQLSLDEKAELLFVDQSGIQIPEKGAESKRMFFDRIIVNMMLNLTQKFTEGEIILGIVYTVCKSYPLSDDFFRYDFWEPFDLKKGWLLWAGIGLIGALIGIGLTGFAMSMFGGEAPQRETDALVRLLPLIGSSSISTVSLLGVTGVLAPLLEETIFRGFLLVALTKWVPTPIAVLISAAVFALAHLTPGQFPQLFILGAALGFSYAHTRNLMTSITIHALWNSGVILFLTFLQLQGYDIRELLQAVS